MFRARRSSSLWSTASSANPALSSVVSSGGSLDRSATLSSLSIAASAPGKQTKKDRPAWKRLTRKISQTLGVKSKKKNVLALPPVEEDPAVRKETRIAAVAVESPPIPIPDVRVPSRDQSTAEECITEPTFNEGAAENELVSRTRAVPMVERQSESTSPALLELLDAIPADLPLIQYIAECLLTDVSPASPHDDAQSNDVESQLFFKSLELKKWSLAQVLAEKIQRRLTFRHQHRTKDGIDGSRDSNGQADKERIRLGSSAIAGDEVDNCDVVLSFLDTCSA